ncbi:MAG: nickel/cobalt transporter [Roseovarius sp.]
MRWIVTALGLGVTVAAVWLWGFGGAAALQGWALDGQREVQQAMAGYLQRLRGGETGALAGLWGICFAYGFFHAAGPGHGKLLIGGYGVGRAVPVRRLAGLAVASSLAQAATAVLLVYAGVMLLGLGREAVTGLADRTLAAASYGAIALVGLWLVLRGLLKLWRVRSRGRDHDHDHDHDHDDFHDHGHDHARGGEVCASCGHRHGPSVEEAAAVHNWREAAALVSAVAIRPCTGALFLLILTWRFGIDLAGIAGAFIMGLGTASVTVVVAVAAVSLREGVLTRLATGSAGARALPVIEIAAGAVIAVVALQLVAAVL